MGAVRLGLTKAGIRSAALGGGNPKFVFRKRITGVVEKATYGVQDDLVPVFYSSFDKQ